MTAIINSYGVEINFDAAVNLMDDEIRESVHADMAPCADQAFFDAYCAAHLAKYGAPCELDTANPQY